MIVLALLFAQPASQPASQPAALAPGGTGRDVMGSATWIYEIDEASLRVQESWSLTNQSGKLVTREHLRFPVPPGARRLEMPEDARGFRPSDDGTAVTATEDMGSGTKTFTAGHIIDFSGSTSVIRRTMPVRLGGARLIVQNIDGIEVTSNHAFDDRISELNGLEFKVLQFAPMEAGSTLEVRIAGLPSRSTWPRFAALALCFGILGWLARTLSKPPDRSEAKVGPLSAPSRRDQIVKALEVLDRDFAADEINDKRYERRHRELMLELASVLEEIELGKGSMSSASPAGHRGIESEG
jgi:hypothetical protein